MNEAGLRRGGGGPRPQLCLEKPHLQDCNHVPFQPRSQCKAAPFQPGYDFTSLFEGVCLYDEHICSRVSGYEIACAAGGGERRGVVRWIDWSHTLVRII